MEISILEETKNKLRFEIKGETYTLCNVLKDELWKDSHVKTSSYRIRHPMVGVPEMVVETDGKEKPRNAVIKAAERLSSAAAKFKKSFSKAK